MNSQTHIAEVHPWGPGLEAGGPGGGGNSAPCGLYDACTRGQENLCDDLTFLSGAYAESIVVPSRIVERNLLRLSPTPAFAMPRSPNPGVRRARAPGTPRSAQRTPPGPGAGPIGLMAAALARDLGANVTIAGLAPGG